ISWLERGLIDLRATGAVLGLPPHLARKAEALHLARPHLRPTRCRVIKERWEWHRLGYAASLNRVLEKEKNSIRHRLSGTALLAFLLPLKEAVSPYNGVTKAQPEPCHEIKQKCRRTPARTYCHGTGVH